MPEENIDNILILFQSVHFVMKAEPVLKQNNLNYKVIPVPRHISSECGICMETDMITGQKILEILTEKGMVVKGAKR